MEKKTKAMYFTELRELVMECIENEEDRNDLVDFIDRQLAALDKRKEDAAKRAEKKRVESDALTDLILAQIGDDLITVDMIVIALDDPEITRNKVTSRLGKLVKEGKIEKEVVKVDGNRRMAYRLVQ